MTTPDTTAIDNTALNRIALAVEVLANAINPDFQPESLFPPAPQDNSDDTTDTSTDEPTETTSDPTPPFQTDVPPVDDQTSTDTTDSTTTE